MSTEEAKAQQEKVFYPKVEEEDEEEQVSEKAKARKVEEVHVSDKAKVKEVQVSDKAKAKWGTHIMGPPAAPSAHPQNQEAATWKAQEEDYDNSGQSPYIVKEGPVQHSKRPMQAVLHHFNKWTKQAENLASNVWINLKTGQSVPDAAWGKLTLGAKALTEGGFEPLFKQTFSVDPEEKLRKTYACYLSTSTGPVAGTLYVSTVKIAFCSDRPLSFTIPSGEEQWSYYRVAIPLVKLKFVNSSTNTDNPAQKYIQVVTEDNYEFWFMGFVNHDKALSTLQKAVAQSHNFSSLPRQ